MSMAVRTTSSAKRLEQAPRWRRTSLHLFRKEKLTQTIATGDDGAQALTQDIGREVGFV